MNLYVIIFASENFLEIRKQYDKTKSLRIKKTHSKYLLHIKADPFINTTKEHSLKRKGGKNEEMLPVMISHAGPIVCRGGVYNRRRD